MSRAIADASVFIAREAGRPLGDLPDEIAVSVVTAAELELGVLRAGDSSVRAVRLRTLSRVRSEYPLLPIDDLTAWCFAQIADEELRAGRKLHRQDAWIAATALQHHAAVVTQDAGFSSLSSVPVIRL
jgi:predicted nucleic acid-binding protein